MKTRAEELGITEFPYKERNENGKMTYFEWYNGYWYKIKYNKNGNLIYRETSDGRWCKWKHNDKGNRIYNENVDGLKIYTIR